ncbi:winged helix-turn-helix domain-containing protein [Candidatus Lokiarchaeum ossiferum]|uniref:winged helix-turn-helix domain-containing protein n=1 Tax=Candidatus Lokiarchaeum ossiferum TaxID=2951803 RepID=UPI00352E361F
MFNRTFNYHLNDKQLHILALLEKKPYQQKDLAVAIGISGAGLLYNLNKLEEADLITKKTLATVGNVSLNEIAIHPNAIQRVRSLLGISKDHYTLITGFGLDSPTFGPSYEIPLKSKALLQKEGYVISRIVAFVTPKSNLKDAKKFETFDVVHEYPYLEYRNDDSSIFQNLESLIQSEQKDSNVILDLTPLTKLLTIRLLEISVKYKIPSFYLGKTTGDEDFLLWVFSAKD